MPVTSIITTEGAHLQIETIWVEETKELVVEVKLCNEEFIPQDQYAVKRYAIKDSHVDFHTTLRAKAALAEQLITSHSTNPEWNPEGYVKNLSINNQEEE